MLDGFFWLSLDSELFLHPHFDEELYGLGGVFFGVCIDYRAPEDSVSEMCGCSVVGGLIPWGYEVPKSIWTVILIVFIVFLFGNGCFVNFVFPNQNLGGGLKDSLFSPGYLGKMIQFDDHMFQIGGIQPSTRKTWISHMDLPYPIIRRTWWVIMF